MTNEHLVVKDGDRSFEIYLNADLNIFIGEIDPEHECVASWFIIRKEDWPVIRRFINKQFSYLEILP